MIRIRRCLLLWLSVFFLVGPLAAETLVLKASKDSFGRSNERNRNNGKSETLLVAHAPNIRTIIAFDLSGATNRIVGATLRLHRHNTMPEPIGLVAAPMVNGPRNSAWKEGTGALGTKGRNALPGEACYGWSAFPEVQWETASGDPVRDLGDARLWQAPIASRKFQWQEGEWIDIEIKDVRALEAMRASGDPTITFGLWGTSGNGIYAIGSRESGKSPELVLVLDGKNGTQ